MNAPPFRDHARHTPGPWFYDDTMKGRVNINSQSAAVASIPYIDAEAVANARLIAAAPDLLDALRRLMREEADGEFTIGLIEDARAAIAKAEGRS
jgi:hypothetical protein